MTNGFGKFFCFAEAILSQVPGFKESLALKIIDVMLPDLIILLI